MAVKGVCSYVHLKETRQASSESHEPYWMELTERTGRLGEMAVLHTQTDLQILPISQTIFGQRYKRHNEAKLCSITF